MEQKIIMKAFVYISLPEVSSGWSKIRNRRQHLELDTKLEFSSKAFIKSYKTEQDGPSSGVNLDLK